MDSSQSVGALVQPPNPMQGIEMMSGMLGLQQRRQELAAGAANLQQTQQKNQELTALAGLTREAMRPGSKYWKGGEFDVDGYRQDATSVAPVYGGESIDQHISAIKNVVGTREAFLKLGDETNKTISDAAKGLATKQGPISDTDIDAFADNMKSTIGSSPEAQYRLGQFVGSLRSARDPDSRQQVARNGAAILGGFMQQTPATQDVGPAIQPTLQSVWGGQAPTGPAINKTGIAPQPWTDAAGGLHVIGGPHNAGGGSSAQPQAKPGAIDLMHPQPGQMQNAVSAAQNDEGRYNAISQEGTNSQAGRALAKQVANLAESVRTGKYTKETADNLTILKQHNPGLTDVQLLSKFAEQLKTTAEKNAATDATKEQISKGMPDPQKMGPDAIKDAAGYVGGIFSMQKERQAHADKYNSTNGSSVGIRGADDAFMRAADPLVYQYRDLPPNERREFLTRKFKTPDEVREFIGRSNQLKHYGGG